MEGSITTYLLSDYFRENLASVLEWLKRNEARGLEPQTIAQLCQQIGVSYCGWRKWALGLTCPRPKNLSRLGEALCLENPLDLLTKNIRPHLEKLHDQ